MTRRIVPARTGRGFRTVCRSACRPFALWILIAGNALAHVQLSPQILDASLADIERLQALVAGDAGTESKATASFEIGTIASEITALMNADAAAHDFEQTELLARAVQRTGAMGVSIEWSDEHRRYFYDGAAFERYVELQPNGLRAADSLFHILERNYYRGASTDIDALRSRVREKRDFLQRFPDYGEAPRIRIYLSIEYRDLWRLCESGDDVDCRDHYGALAREQLEFIREHYPGTAEGPVAGGLLERFEKEFGTPSPKVR